MADSPFCKERVGAGEGPWTVPLETRRGWPRILQFSSYQEALVNRVFPLGCPRETFAVGKGFQVIAEHVDDEGSSGVSLDRPARRNFSTKSDAAKQRSCVPVARSAIRAGVAVGWHLRRVSPRRRRGVDRRICSLSSRNSNGKLLPVASSTRALD